MNPLHLSLTHPNLGAVLHEGPADHAANRRTYVTVTCGKREYACSYDYVPAPQAEREERLPQFSAFMHLSGRQLVHENMLTLLRRILAELRSPVFWLEYKEKYPASVSSHSPPPSSSFPYI